MTFCKRVCVAAGTAGLLLGCLLGALPAKADHFPTFVVPGKRGVPVMIDGVDASGAVVYGNWGLHRPGHGSRLIEGGGPGYERTWQGSYFPATGRAPLYGRKEIEPAGSKLLR